MSVYCVLLQYAGLFMFCGYVVFDTQMIIEKASMGDKDVLKHTLDLFMGEPCYEGILRYRADADMPLPLLLLCHRPDVHLRAHSHRADEEQQGRQQASRGPSRLGSSTKPSTLAVPNAQRTFMRSLKHAFFPKGKIKQR